MTASVSEFLLLKCKSLVLEGEEIISQQRLHLKRFRFELRSQKFKLNSS